MEYGNSRYDPYKILLYKIIGRCEVEKMGIPIVIKTTEDYMWLELSLIRDNVNEESYSSERFRLSDFQQKIASCGPMHFDPHGNNPWFYFKILLLSLQFERVLLYTMTQEEENSSSFFL
jgi:nuclear pore complex protein Nup93